MLRLTLTVFFCICSVSAFARGNSDIKLEYDTHRPGADYHNFKTGNVDNCSNECQADDRCAAFDYILSDRRCWLKDQVPRRGHNRNGVSGVKIQHHDYNNGRDRVVAGIRIQQGVKRPGRNYTKFETRNAGKCARECANDDRCMAFNFNKSKRICQLKDRVEPVRDNNNFASGVKQHHDQNYGGSSPGHHREGNIFWDYSNNRPCPHGYVNCDASRGCAQRGNASSCRN